jgi:ATP-dependent DNA helicase RecG
MEDVLCNIEAAEQAAERLLFRNAGVLFFAREARRFFNQAYVTCILFRGSDRIDVLDRKDFAGGVVSDIEDSLRFIQRNTRTAYRIQALQREEISEYPMAALREAITNAVMHRDWFIEGANVFVEIYTDRIEIASPGGLPAGLSAAELGTRSVRRNPLVADLLHRIGFIEKAGTGIGRMRKEARDHGCPAPEFRVDRFFTAVFRPLPATHQVGTKPALSRHQVLILEKSIVEQPLRELMAVTGRTDRTKFRRQLLGPLLQAGYVEMTRPDKPQSSKQRYRITALGRKTLNQESERSHDN